MKNIFLFIGLCVVSLLFTKCDKIDNPYPKLNTINTSGVLWDDSSYVTSSSTTRNVLIEEFTGHLCTFCPNGAREIERLDSIYGEQIIPVSIHAGSFADVPAGGAGFDANGDLVMDYTSNFKTPAGDEYFTTFGVSSNPAATVSRLNNASITGLSQWEIDFNTIKNDLPTVKISLTSLYNDSSRTVKAIVNTEWLSTQTGSYNLQLYLVEDSITAWQLDNGVHVQDYLHRHVLRKAINGTWGSPIPSSNVGDIDNQEFAITLSNDWNKNHCSIVAHVYKASPNYEVMQAEKIKVTSIP